MTQTRNDPLKNGYYYHIFTRSIAKFIVINSPSEFERILHLIELYRYANLPYRYSDFNDFNISAQRTIIGKLRVENNILVEIVAFCIMPTHIHLIIKQISNEGISKYMGRILNSYSRYFNIKHKRTGPLWSGRFKNVLISDDTQLLHLTRYIHLNPTSAKLVNQPENWKYSSHNEYINTAKNNHSICKFGDIIDKNPLEYKKFVNDGKSYQQELTKIKNILFDNYSG